MRNAKPDSTFSRRRAARTGKRGSTLLAIVLSAVGLAPAVARRDTGDDTGVARDVRGDVRGIAGRLEETVIGTCAATTGRAVESVHLVLALADGQRPSDISGRAAQSRSRSPRSTPATRSAPRSSVPTPCRWAPPAFEMPSAAVATLHDASAGAVSRRAAWASSPVPDRAGARSRSTSALAVKSS